METALPYRWPFALDVLKKQYDALPSQRLLTFQSQYFDEIGPNMRLGLFGQDGYMTIDPKNIETILSTHFEGMYFTCLISWRQVDLFQIGGLGLGVLASTRFSEKGSLRKMADLGDIPGILSAASLSGFSTKI